MMKALRLVLMAAVFWVGMAPGAAVAQDMQEQAKSACKADYRRFCFGTLPGSGRILACLSKNLAELSPDCARTVAIGMDCAEDYKKLCTGEEAKSAGAKFCLQSQGDKLSPNCAKTLTAAQ